MAESALFYLSDAFCTGIKRWQLPYFVPKNKLFPEIIEKGLHVKNDKGNIPFEDAVLDFTNPETISWYQQKIGDLLKMGVSAIKVDFGEAAPYDGLYSGAGRCRNPADAGGTIYEGLRLVEDRIGGIYGSAAPAKGKICFPEDNVLREPALTRKGKRWLLDKGGLPEGVSFEIMEVGK